MERQQQADDSGAALKIAPQTNDLQKKCLRPGDASAGAMEAIARAEQALEDLSVNFDDWMKEEVARLSTAGAKVCAGDTSEATLDALFEASHDLKGQAATLGYPFAARVGASLCRLLDQRGPDGNLPTKLVAHHVDAIKAIVRETSAHPANQTAAALVQSLEVVTDVIVKR